MSVASSQNGRISDTIVVSGSIGNSLLTTFDFRIILLWRPEICHQTGQLGKEGSGESKGRLSKWDSSSCLLDDSFSSCWYFIVCVAILSWCVVDDLLCVSASFLVISTKCLCISHSWTFVRLCCESNENVPRSMQMCFEQLEVCSRWFSKGKKGKSVNKTSGVAMTRTQSAMLP